LDIEESPHELVERLQHYFLTYKQVPGEGEAEVEITDVYGREEAHEVIRRSQRDYENSYGHIKAAKARLARL
jgi:inorganic pyrophosphatase